MNREKGCEKNRDRPRKKGWLLYGAGSALFCQSDGYFGQDRHSRSRVQSGNGNPHDCSSIMAWGMVLLRERKKKSNRLIKKNWYLSVFPGVATGASWLCYYRALQEGPASVVAPVDKLSVLVTAAFSWIVFRGKTGKRRRQPGWPCLQRGQLLWQCCEISGMVLDGSC